MIGAPRQVKRVGLQRESDWALGGLGAVLVEAERVTRLQIVIGRIELELARRSHNAERRFGFAV